MRVLLIISVLRIGLPYSISKHIAIVRFKWYSLNILLSNRPFYRITLCQSLRWLKLADMMYRKIQINFNFWSSVDIRLYWNVLSIFASHANQDFYMEWFIYISSYPHVLSIFTYNKWNTTTSTQNRLPKLKVDRLQVNMGLPNNLNLWAIGRIIYFLPALP